MEKNSVTFFCSKLSPSKWRSKGEQVGHAPQGAGLGGASIHVYSHLKKDIKIAATSRASAWWLRTSALYSRLLL